MSVKDSPEHAMQAYHDSLRQDALYNEALRAVAESDKRATEWAEEYRKERDERIADKARIAELEDQEKARHKLLVPNPCSICGGPIKVLHFGCIGTGDGSMENGGSFAHGECYHRQRADLAEARIADLRDKWEAPPTVQEIEAAAVNMLGFNPAVSVLTAFIAGRKG